MVHSFDREVAHLPFDHAWIAAVSAFRIELIEHLGKQHPIVIIVVSEGEKTPGARRGTG